MSGRSGGGGKRSGGGGGRRAGGGKSTSRSGARASGRPARRGGGSAGKPGAKASGPKAGDGGGRRLDRARQRNKSAAVASRVGPSRGGPNREGPSRDGPGRDGPGRDGPGQSRRPEATRPCGPKPVRHGGKGAAPQQGGACFIDSVTSADAVPEGPPEFAFVGRSNVGKSSLLNALSRHKSLARTSKTPGRTQRVNLFDVPLQGGLVLRFADLPGYGHAKVPGAIRKSFGPMIEGYLLGRRSILAVCVLVDARRDPDEDAINFILWLHDSNIRVELVVTKMDKIPKTKHLNVLERMRIAHGMERRPWATSTLSGSGVDELRLHLRHLATKRPRR